MWLKQAICQYSNRLSLDNQAKPWDPLWIKNRGLSSADVSRRFGQAVMIPLVQHLNRDLQLSLQCAPGGSAVPCFHILNRTEFFGKVYMANPLNGRAFFRYPNGLSVEIHSYHFLLEDLRKRQGVNQTTENMIIRKPRGFSR